MNILAFDTSFAACSAAAGRVDGSDTASGGAKLKCRFEAMETGHAERLVPMIGEVMDAAGLTFPEIDRIAIAHGPGSFTGTRIAVAAARALALTTRGNVVGLSSLTVMAAAARGALEAILDEGLLAVAVDARRGEVYVQLYEVGRGTEVSELTEPAVLAVAQAAELGGERRLVVAGSAAGAVVAAARERGRNATAHLPDLMPNAAELAKLAVTAVPVGGPIRPLYLRPADAKPQTGKSIERVKS